MCYELLNFWFLVSNFMLSNQVNKNNTYYNLDHFFCEVYSNT